MFSEACVKNSVHKGGGVWPRPSGEVGGSGQMVSKSTPGGKLGVWLTGVSRPTPREVSPGLHLGGLQAQAWGEVEGSGWGVSRPTPKGGSPGPHPRGSPGPGLGGPGPGGYPSMH